MIKEKALEYFRNGYSCSESVMQACVDEGLCGSELLPCATTFSGGMSSGCVCGTIAASQIILGSHFGKNNKYENPVVGREKAAKFVEEFKKRNKVTCCRVLCAGLEGSARKEHCAKLVTDACEILEELIKVKV